MEISRQVFKDIHEIFQLANTSADSNCFMSEMIHLLFNLIHAESSVVYLSKDITHSKGDIEINLDKSYVRQYKKYYHQYDPILWIDEFSRLPVVRVEDMLDYRQFMTGEFYNDFLMPQKIHYKLYLNLFSGNHHHARIGLYKSLKSKRFSKQDIGMLKIISPYLGHAMDHHKLLLNNRMQNFFFNILDENSSKGIILVDDSLRLVHMNRTARLFCENLHRKNLSSSSPAGIPPVLLEDCRILREKRKKDDFLDLPRCKILQTGNSEQISVLTRALFKKITHEKKKFYLISLEKKLSPQKILHSRLKKRYTLSEREHEIAHCIFEGLKNIEIANKVFLSEVTVKKHIQSIFKKMKVKNRASVVRKIAEEHQNLAW